MTTREKTACGVAAANLLFFILLTSGPLLSSRHHHWIFPLTALGVAGQWALTGIPAVRVRVDVAAARSVWLSILGLIAVLGIVRHQSVLTCFDTCSLKLSYALWISSALFFLQNRAQPIPFWNAVRCEWTFLAGILWAVYLTLFGRGLAPWILELVLFAAALLLWLGRHRPAVLLIALGVPTALTIRHVPSEGGRILLALAGVALSLGLAPALDQRWRDLPPNAPVPWGRRMGASLLRILAAVGAVVLLVILAMGPTRTALDPTLRRAHLLSVAVRPTTSHDALSPLARDLKGHVTTIAGTIGPRPIYNRETQARTRAYIVKEFRRAGYTPEVQEYKNQWLPHIPRGNNFANVEAVRKGRAGRTKGVYIIGAHYDTADGTPGADDNTSGVAVLLETARLLATIEVPHDIHFVTFGTEEPPSYGTINMGSAHYAQKIKTENVPVRLMLSLEMLGYYNDRPGSQLYPPFLQLFFPDRGNFVSLVSNGSSRRHLKVWEKTWRSVSPFPLEGAVLPSVLSQWALSDQLNFWDAGFPALMLSDTAFFRNPHYHEPSDKPDTLDYNKMAQVTQALAAVLSSIDR